MTTEQERVQELVREMYEAAESANWDLSPEDIRAQRRRPFLLMPEPKALVLAAAAAVLIVTGFFAFGRSASHKPAIVAGSTTTTTSTINPNTLAATLACLHEFAPGTSQPDGVLVGKSLSVARSLTAGFGQTWRIVAQDGTCKNVTSDLQSGRVDLWIIDGRVVKAVLEGVGSTTTSTTTNQSAQSVVVPNVIGLAQSQAGLALGAADLSTGNISSFPSATIGAGKVVDETPVTGSSVANGSSVDLVVSEGP